MDRRLIDTKDKRAATSSFVIAGPFFFRSLLKNDALFGAILLLATLFAYKPAWQGAPVWDDEGHITKPELQSLYGLARIWTEPGATHQYYPLVHSVFWLEHRLYGDAPLGYHLLNVLLHALSAFLLYEILRKLSIHGASLAAAIFALHPIEVESVAWISELKNCMSGVFFFSAILTYLQFDRNRSLKSYLASFWLFLLGLMSKTVIAPMPAAILILLWWKSASTGRLHWKRDLLPLLPFFLAGVSFGLFTAWMERRYVIGPEDINFNYSLIERGLIAGRVFWFYLGKLIFPSNLTFIYPRWVISLAAWRQYLFPIGAIALAAVILLLRRRSKAPLAAFLYFVAMLFPALGFFNVYPFRYSFVADHFQYLAGIGPLALVSSSLHSALTRMEKRFTPAVRLLPMIILFILAVLTWRQCRMYADEETLYRTTIQKNPKCWLAYLNLGVLSMRQGRMDEALIDCRKSLDLNPDYIEGHTNLGLVLFSIGRTEEALMHLRRVLEIRPDFAMGHFNLGNAWIKLGRLGDAIAEYQKALSIHPFYAVAHNNLAFALWQLGRTDEAIAEYRKALTVNPLLASLYTYLGSELLQQGRTDEALAQYRKAVAFYQKTLAIRPDDLNVLNYLCLAYAQIGRADSAVLTAEKALALAKSAGNKALARDIARVIEEIRR